MSTSYGSTPGNSGVALRGVAQNGDSDDDDVYDPYGKGAPVGFGLGCIENDTTKIFARGFGYATLLASVGCLVMMLNAHPRWTQDGWRGSIVDAEHRQRGGLPHSAVSGLNRDEADSESVIAVPKKAEAVPHPRTRR